MPFSLAARSRLTTLPWAAAVLLGLALATPKTASAFELRYGQDGVGATGAASLNRTGFDRQPSLRTRPEVPVVSVKTSEDFNYAANNPINFTDPTGKAAETIWDAGNVALGVASIAAWDDKTSMLDRALDVGGLVLDTAAVALPFVPGGVAAVLKAGRAAGKADELVDVARGVDRAAEVGGAGLSLSQMKTVLRSAGESYKGTTRLGHALSKHVNRGSELWGKLTGPSKTWHEQATKHFREIYDAPGTFSRVTNDKGVTFLEKMHPDGRGIRLQLDHVFKGFIE